MSQRTTPTAETTPAANPPSQPLFVGGPPATISMGPATTAAAPAAPTPEAPKATPVFLGGRMFNSTEDALAYASQLAAAPPVAQNFQAAPQTPAKIVDPSDLIFEDPKAALDLHEKRITDRIEAKKNAANAEAKVWSDFFESYPDLRGEQDIVHMTRQKLLADPQIATMPLSQSLQILAKETRARVAKWKGSAGVTSEQLSSRPAMTASPGGAPAPVVPSGPAPQKSFVDELREMREAKKKRA